MIFYIGATASCASFELIKYFAGEYSELTLSYAFNLCFSCQSWAAITIEGNDLMNGEIGFIPGSQTETADEDGAGTGEETLDLYYLHAQT